MNLQQILQTIGERLHVSAGARAMYGAPIVAEGKTLIPVGRVAFGFGAGRGSQYPSSPNEGQADLGTGFGGGVVAHPLGMVEVTAERTRFIPCQDRRTIWGVLVLGVVLGFLMRGRGR